MASPSVVILASLLQKIGQFLVIFWLLLQLLPLGYARSGKAESPFDWLLTSVIIRLCVWP